MEKIVIIGAGAHSKVIIDMIEQLNTYEIVGLLDVKPGSVLGYQVLGNDDDMEEVYRKGIRNTFVAVGNNSLRKVLYQKASSIGFNLISVVSHNAIVSDHATIGNGVAVMPGAVINAGATISNGVIINTNASVDHDCKIGEFTHVAPGCAVSGSTEVGSCCLLGTGARVIDRLSIGDNVIIGAGAAVVDNIMSNVLAVGVPARIKKHLE